MRRVAVGVGVAAIMLAACGRGSATSASRCDVLRHRLEAAISDPHSIDSTPGLDQATSDQVLRARTAYRDASTKQAKADQQDALFDVPAGGDPGRLDRAWTMYSQEFIASHLADSHC